MRKRLRRAERTALPGAAEGTVGQRAAGEIHVQKFPTHSLWFRVIHLTGKATGRPRPRTRRSASPKELAEVPLLR